MLKKRGRLRKRKGGHLRILGQSVASGGGEGHREALTEISIACQEEVSGDGVEDTPIPKQAELNLRIGLPRPARDFIRSGGIPILFVDRRALVDDVGQHPRFPQTSYAADSDLQLRIGSIMKTILLSFFAAGMLAAPVVANAAQADVGKLDCDVSKGIGVIVGSKQDVDCTYTPNAAGDVSQHYVGTITDFGLDVGTVEEGRMVWLVFNATREPVAGLQGNYAGVTADASVGIGGGANVLVGGTSKTVSLQPVSLEGDVGVNLAVGVAALKLRLAD